LVIDDAIAGATGIGVKEFAVSKRMKIVALLAAVVGAIALMPGAAAAGGRHHHHHGHYGPHDSFHPGFGLGLGVRYSGVYYYAPPPVYYYDPGPECGWDYVRIWRYGDWRARRVWRCW
jgi:hypothetical protein